jgi:molybdate transport system regulatory protein
VNASLPTLRFRLLLGELRLGPGKADLLEAVDRTGSISAAARAMGMSYARAWRLLSELNGGFGPVVETRRGGGEGGGAALTDKGRAVLDAYRGLQAELDAVAAPTLTRLIAMGRA